MYFPYFRGKQYELVMLKEMAPRLAAGHVIPILEPVKINISSLQRCIGELKTAEAPFILISNPRHGDFKTNNLLISDELIPSLADYEHFQIGYTIDKNSELSSIRSELEQYRRSKIALIHYGYPDGSAIAEMLRSRRIPIETNVFIDEHCGQRYKQHFEGIADTKVLIKDGFEKSKNADYIDDEPFSELHLTYEDNGYQGFGDFSIVGDQYSESGGPAYAIAIHITYFRQDDEINIRHYVSDRKNSPVDPAGKFQEALAKLIEDVEEDDSVITRTESIGEFVELYEQERYPGLGYLKKLAMKHHLELLLNYLSR
jgi:hypothetical protein